MNTKHTGKFTTLRAVYILTWWRNVDVTKSCHSPCTWHCHHVAERRQEFLSRDVATQFARSSIWGIKVWTLAVAPLTWVRLVTSSALQSRKWQLIGMSQWCRSALCGHPLPALTDNWTDDAASRHTIAPISHTRPSPRSRSYKLLLISRPAEGRRLSWPEHTVG